MQSFVNRLIRMDHLILYKSTGRPADLASKLDISERSVYEYIRFMKGLGAPICFSRNRRKSGKGNCTVNKDKERKKGTKLEEKE